jgi:hypothetical protein
MWSGGLQPVHAQQAMEGCYAGAPGCAHAATQAELLALRVGAVGGVIAAGRGTLLLLSRLRHLPPLLLWLGYHPGAAAIASWPSHQNSVLLLLLLLLLHRL